MARKRKLEVGFLGPETTFSHQAALSIFSSETKLKGYLGPIDKEQ